MSAIVLVLLLCIFRSIEGRDCNSATLNVTLTDASTSPFNLVNLFAVGVCTPGQDGNAQDISQIMECENGTVIQKLYPNANCSDEPFRQNEDIDGYCGGDICEEYAMVLTSLNESCSNSDGYWILPMLMNDCYQYSFGQDKGASYKFVCDDLTQINLGIFESADCSDDTYESYTLYEDGGCDDAGYAEIISCPKDSAIKVSVLFTIFFIIIHTILR